MRVRVLDLDGGILAQERLLRITRPEIADLHAWGMSLRGACRWSTFHRFERRLDRLLRGDDESEPTIHFLGSGDYHHLTLAMLRRLRQPCNLLVLDKHGDWMRGLPFLYCGGWLHHAAKLPNVRRIFHVGGDERFDRMWNWLAPTSLLRRGKIVMLPARRVFRAGFLRNVPHRSLRDVPELPLDRDRLEDLLWPHLDELDRYPLFISLDKDVLWLPESVVNGDSGVLELSEVQEILQFFMKAASNDVVGMDICGDWSAAPIHGWPIALLNRRRRSHGPTDAEEARLTNERTNLCLLRFLINDPVAARVSSPSRLKSA